MAAQSCLAPSSEPTIVMVNARLTLEAGFGTWQSTQKLHAQKASLLPPLRDRTVAGGELHLLF
jgi:hypothetical protein